MKVLHLSGYFRLRDDADLKDLEAAMQELSKFFLGPDPEEVDAKMPVEIPHREKGPETDEMWNEFWKTVYKGRRLLFRAGIHNVEAEGVPEIDR